MAGQIIAFTLGIGLSLIPLFENLFAPNANQITTVKVALGSLFNNTDNLGGNTPGVALWDKSGQAIGAVDGSSKILQAGALSDSIKIFPNATVGNVQAQYMSITNGGNDAICVAYVLITFPDGQGTSAFAAGDVAKACNFDWFPSENVVGTAGWTPACVWIDRDDSNGHKYQGFGVHLPDFYTTTSSTGLKDQYTTNRDTVCRSGPRFRMYESLKTEDPILVFNPHLIYNDDGSDVDPSIVINNPGVFADIDRDLKKRDNNPNTPNAATTLTTSYTVKYPNTTSTITNTNPSPSSTSTDARFLSHLVISSLIQHSAREVCESSSSRAPDFISTVESLHCDMTTRLLTALCTSTAVACCFDITVNQMRACGYVRVGLNNASVSGTGAVAKTYQHIVNW